MSWKDILLKGQWKGARYWTGKDYANSDTGKAIELYWGSYPKPRPWEIPEYIINRELPFKEVAERNERSQKDWRTREKVSKQEVEEMTMKVLKDLHKKLSPEEQFSWDKVDYKQLIDSTVMVSYEHYWHRRNPEALQEY